MKNLFFHVFLLIIINKCVIIILVRNMKKITNKKEVKVVKKENFDTKKVVKNVKQKENNRVYVDNKQTYWWILGLVCPVIGIILYFMWINRKKTSAKNILTGTIIGSGLWIFIGLSVMISGNTNTNKPVKVEQEAKFVASDWYNDTLASKVVTVIGSSTCPHCQEYKPVISALAEEFGFKLYFVEADKVTEEDNSVLYESYDLKNYEGYVPYTFIVDKGKFVTDTTGFESKDTTLKFLKENKIIKN